MRIACSDCGSMNHTELIAGDILCQTCAVQREQEDSIISTENHEN